MTREQVEKRLACLVKLPTPHRRILSMAITNSCAAGREMPRARKQPILYMMCNSPGDIPKDRPRDIRNPGHIILPIMKILSFGPKETPVERTANGHEILVRGALGRGFFPFTRKVCSRKLSVFRTIPFLALLRNRSSDGRRLVHG